MDRTERRLAAPPRARRGGASDRGKGPEIEGRRDVVVCVFVDLAVHGSHRKNPDFFGVDGADAGAEENADVGAGVGEKER